LGGVVGDDNSTLLMLLTRCRLCAAGAFNPWSHNSPRVEIEISRLEVAKKELLKKERDVGAG